MFSETPDRLIEHYKEAKQRISLGNDISGWNQIALITLEVIRKRSPGRFIIGGGHACNLPCSPSFKTTGKRRSRYDSNHII